MRARLKWLIKLQLVGILGLADREDTPLPGEVLTVGERITSDGVSVTEALALTRWALGDGPRRSALAELESALIELHKIADERDKLRAKLDKVDPVIEREDPYIWRRTWQHRNPGAPQEPDGQCDWYVPDGFRCQKPLGHDKAHFHPFLDGIDADGEEVP